MRTGRIPVPDSHFAITLADGWSSVPTKLEDDKAFLKTLPAGSALGAVMGAQLAMLPNDVDVIWAMDTTTITPDFADDFEAFVTSDEFFDFKSQEASEQERLTGQLIPGTELESQVSRGPAGTSGILRLTYHMETLNSSFETIEVTEADYYVWLVPNVLWLQFKCAAERADSCLADADSMMQTFEVLP